MAFTFAYNLNGEGATPVNDYTAATGYLAKQGEVVKLNGSGEVVAATAADTAVLGVSEGMGYFGLFANTPTVSTKKAYNETKVRTHSGAVYRVPLKSGATAPVRGTKYGIALVNGDAQLDTAVTGAAAIYQVQEYDAATKKAFVTITARQMG